MPHFSLSVWRCTWRASFLKKPQPLPQVERAPRFLYLRDPLFLASLGLYFFNRFVLLRAHWPLPSFFHTHLADCLLMPVALPALLYLQRGMGTRSHDCPPTPAESGFWLVIWSALFEAVLPRFVPRGTADVWDVVAYAAGGLLAYLFWQFYYGRQARLAPVPVTSQPTVSREQP